MKNTTSPKSCLALIPVLLLSVALQAQNFKVTLLGTGYPRPVMERFGPSILVEAGEQKLLFDCGRGATQRLFQSKVPFASVTALFLTHLHSDHIVGIPDFWLSGWIMGRKSPLRVWGPAGTKEMMSHLEQAYQYDIHIRRDVDEKLPADGIITDAHDIVQGVVYESGGVKVTAFSVDHGLVKPAFGYRVDYQGHSVVLSGDTRFSENLIRFAQGTDVLVHEVLDPEAYREISTSLTPEQMKKVIAHHTNPEQAGTIFNRVKPKLAVYSHIVPFDAPDLIAHTRKTYSGPLEVGEDLMSIEIGDKVAVHRPAR
jgi:ribonuclease Z